MGIKSVGLKRAQTEVDYNYYKGSKLPPAQDSLIKKQFDLFRCYSYVFHFLEVDNCDCQSLSHTHFAPNRKLLGVRR
jgi:hypothetical protein